MQQGNPTMSNWAACITVADFAELAALRLFPGLECGEANGMVWLRGNTSGEELDRTLAKVPGLERFEVLESGRLKSPHSRIPGGKLPPVAWRPLKELLVPALPTAAMAGETRQKLALTLVRSGVEQPPAALLTTLSAWTGFAERAPVIRLDGLAFAVSDDQQALVLGKPVPPLPGIRMVNQSGILTPCGFAWSPPVEPAALKDLFALGPNDVVVLAEDGTHQVIRSEQFVRASRSAARATREEFNAHDR